MSNVVFNSTICGEYRLVIQKPGGEEVDTGWFNNLILDIGLDRLGSDFNKLTYCRVGSGTSTPTNTQTALDAQLASVFGAGGGQPDTATNEGTPLYRSVLTFSFAFAQGDVVGNISEVGTGWADTGPTLFSRALILDNLGNPITLTLVSIDQLTVYYRVRISPPLVDASSSVTISGTSYNFTTRILSADTYAASTYLMLSSYFSTAQISGTYGAGASLAPITSTDPIGTQSGSSGTFTGVAYTPASYYKDSTGTWTPVQGNATGGIQVLVVSWGGPFASMRFQIYFPTVIPKTSTTTLTLTIRFSWARG